MTTLAELHAAARIRGLVGYRRLAKAELAALLTPRAPEAPVGALLTPRAPEAPRAPVRLERDGPLALILLDDRDTRNALTGAAIDAFGAVLDTIAGDESIALVAVMGVGPMFCSGADLPESGTALLVRLAALPVPTLALVNGHAVGGGVDVALACDWRLIDPESELRFVHASLGLVPGSDCLGRLARIVGAGTALRLITTCESVDGRRAVTLGLADDAIGYRDQRARARALAARVAGADRGVVAAVVRGLAPYNDAPPGRRW